MVRKAALYVIILFSVVCLSGYFYRNIFSSLFFYIIVIMFFLSMVVAVACMVKPAWHARSFNKWLTLSFHVCLTAGTGLLIIARMVRMEGEVVLTEGQNITEAHANYTRISEGPLFRERHAGFQLMLEKVEENIYKKGDIPDYVSVISVHENGNNPLKAEVRINHPFKFKGFVIHQSRTGFSPLVTIEEKGMVLVNSYVNLSTVKEGDSEIPEDEILIPSRQAMLRMRLLPEKGGKGPLDLVLKQGDRISGTARLEMGMSKELSGYTVSFRGLRRWSGLQLVRDPFIPSLYAVFGLGIIMLFVMLFGKI